MKILRKPQPAFLAFFVLATLGASALRAQEAPVPGHQSSPAPAPLPTTLARPPAAYAASLNSIPDPRTPPASKPGALTLAQVLDLARTKNPTLLAAEQNLQAVQRPGDPGRRPPEPQPRHRRFRHH